MTTSGETSSTLRPETSAWARNRENASVAVVSGCVRITPVAWCTSRRIEGEPGVRWVLLVGQTDGGPNGNASHLVRETSREHDSGIVECAGRSALEIDAPVAGSSLANGRQRLSPQPQLSGSGGGAG